MSIFQALVLGLVQGLTEFLPVSSSGHLTLVPFLFGWDEPSLAFVVAVHLGTLAAVVAIFREQVSLLVRTARRRKEAPDYDRRLLRLVVIGTIPAVVVGAVFEGLIGDAFERPVLVSLLLGVTGSLLMSTESRADHREAPRRGDETMSQGDATAIGIAQAIAVLPGISRSGTTISAGMRVGLTRTTAARFSFLLSIPVIAGALIFEIPDMFSEAGRAGAAPFLFAIVASAVSGFYSIRWFLGMIQRRGLRPFGVYCFLAMVAGLVAALARG